MAKFHLLGNDTHKTKLNSQRNEEQLIFKGCLLPLRLSCWYLTTFKYTQLYSFVWAKNFASCIHQEQNPVEKIRTYEGASTRMFEKVLTE